MRRSRELIGENENGRPVQRTFWIAISAIMSSSRVPRRLEALGVEADSVVLLRLQPQNFGSDVLDSVQQLTITGQQQRSVAAAEFNCNFGRRSEAAEVDVSSDNRYRTGGVAGVGLHLAVAGKNVGFEMQTA